MTSFAVVLIHRFADADELQPASKRGCTCRVADEQVKCLVVPACRKSRQRIRLHVSDVREVCVCVCVCGVSVCLCAWCGQARAHATTQTCARTHLNARGHRQSDWDQRVNSRRILAFHAPRIVQKGTKVDAIDSQKAVARRRCIVWREPRDRGLVITEGTADTKLGVETAAFRRCGLRFGPGGALHQLNSGGQA